MWTYDNASNIVSRKEYAYTIGAVGTPTDTAAYTYGDSEWGDLLTAYDGNTISSDAIGNMLSDGSWTYSWERGRRLASMTAGSTTWSYTYNNDGMRIKRTDGTTTYTYFYNGDLLRYVDINGTKLYFVLDASGQPIEVSYVPAGTATTQVYYYVMNLQGDVTAILDTAGNPVVQYTYDAWGSILSVTGAMASTLGMQNPFRYRGYVYDTETGFYYLQSRYYNPTLGRFLNADAFTSTGDGIMGNNMFAYCGNNPVNRIDKAGERYEVIDPSALGGYGGGFSLASLLFPFAWLADILGGTKAEESSKAVTVAPAKTTVAPNVEVKTEVIPAPPPSPTVIYRHGGTNPSNLTPKDKDKYTGLSFSTVPSPGAAMTTIEALNATGLVIAIKDGATHVSVRPVGATVEDWINAGKDSIWTKTVKSLVVKWAG